MQKSTLQANELESLLNTSEKQEATPPILSPKKRAIAALKLFLWLSLIGAILGPLGFYWIQANSLDAHLSMNVFEFTSIVIFSAYIFLFITFYFAKWVVKTSGKSLPNQFLSSYYTVFFSLFVAIASLITMATIPPDAPFKSLTFFQQLTFILFWTSLGFFVISSFWSFIWHREQKRRAFNSFKKSDQKQNAA